MLIKRRLAKLVSFIVAAACIIVVAVLAVFKGGKLIEFFTPAPTIESSDVTTATLQTVKVFRKEGDPQGLAIVVSERVQSKETAALVKDLATQGVLTILVDFAKLRQQRAARPASSWCQYYSDDFKDAAESVLRSLHFKQYFFPVVVGLDDAAPFAYGVIAQAPKNTLAGAVSSGFSTVLKTDRPFCPGPSMKAVGDAPVGNANNRFQIANDKALLSPWYVIASSAEQNKVEEFQTPLDKAMSNTVSGESAKRKSIVAAVMELQHRTQHGVQSLPVAIIRPQGAAKALMVIVSGDGGWRDIDERIGAYLATKGVAVVGLDSLRYFWSRREPASIAADIEMLLTEYGKEFKTDTYAVAGYSFGANVIPFAWPLITRPTRKKVRLISLLGLSPKTDFEISVEGYLGSNSDSAEAIKPLLERLPLTRTQCFYGAQEITTQATACTFPELDKAERIETSGGHHFDKNYEALADKIASRLFAQPPVEGSANP